MTEDEIINLICGGDRTTGSCASLSLAYAGQKAGLNVFDFRGGVSRDYFSDYDTWNNILQLPGINPITKTAKASLTVGNQLLKLTKQGKQYILCVGEHATIVRKTEEDILEYLELQASKFDPQPNGWTKFNGNPKHTLAKRFGCEDGRGKTEEGFLVDIDDFKESDDFQTLLGYLNTAPDKQMKGLDGYAK